MRGATRYDEDCNLQVTNFVLAAAPTCTVNVPTLCGHDATQWVLACEENVIHVRGRCDEHDARSGLDILKRVNPLLMAIGVITHEDDFAEVIA